MRTPELSSRAHDGEVCCHASTWPSDPPCPNPGTWHIAWLLAPRGHFSLVCDAHMEAVAKAYDYVGRHPASIMCAMPGVGWMTRIGEPSRCVIGPTHEPSARGQQ